MSSDDHVLDAVEEHRLLARADPQAAAEEYEALRAALETAEAERDKARREANIRLADQAAANADDFDMVERMQAAEGRARAAAEARVGVLEAALRKYGLHLSGCAYDRAGDCDCGFAAVLAVPKEEGS